MVGSPGQLLTFGVDRHHGPIPVAFIGGVSLPAGRCLQLSIGPATVMAEFDGNGQATNLQAMSASELYLASYARKPAGPRG